MQKAAIYYRVSTDKQDLDSQKQAIESYIKALESSKKPTKVTEYIDEGISGAKTNRPAYQKLLDDCYKKKIDTIIVYKLDRFSRNATDAIRTLLDLDECNVAFVSVTQPVLNLGHDNPFRRTMLAAFAEIAEIERQTIVQRVKAGLEAAKQRGTKLGAPTKIDDSKREEILTRRKAGMSYRAIAKELELSFGSVQKVGKSAGL